MKKGKVERKESKERREEGKEEGRVFVKERGNKGKEQLERKKVRKDGR